MDDLEYDDVEIMLSALEHYSYCPRQCALIHLEQTYEENIYTIKGLLVHKGVDSGIPSSGRGVKAVRALPLWSARYGLRGKADLVEFSKDGQPYPVEYKLNSQNTQHAALQLCAQAICLEEMFEVAVPRGALYHANTRQREEIALDDNLRQQTVATIEAVREMWRNQQLPAAPNDKRCRHCSLINSCLPGVVAEPARLRGFQATLFIPFSLSL